MSPAVNPWSETLVRGKPRREDLSQNGVRVIVHRNENGSTVEADCHCLGSTMHTHSDPYCPVIKLNRVRRLRGDA